MSRPTLRHTPDEERVMPSGHSALQVGVTDVGKVRVLTLVGALNATTYAPIRDTIVKAALDEPDSVVNSRHVRMLLRCDGSEARERRRYRCSPSADSSASADSSVAYMGTYRVMPLRWAPFRP